MVSLASEISMNQLGQVVHPSRPSRSRNADTDMALSPFPVRLRRDQMVMIRALQCQVGKE
jgi:hypothetical protein